MGAHTSGDDPRLGAVLDDVRRLVRELRLSARGAEARAGVSAAQLFVLQRLADRGPLSVNELAAATLTDQSTVSVVVRRLAARRLVTVRRSPADARRHEAELTVWGRRLLRAAPEPVQARLIEALRALPAARRDDLHRGLQALTQALGLDRQRPPLFFEDERASTRARRRRRP